MGKRARNGVGGSGHRRPRVDLTHAADASAAAGVPGAPDYDSWNRNADPDPADPVQAALAAKARRMQALGPLGEHLAGYGEDDDAEEGDGMGKEPATATEPAPPWTRLVDEKTRHPYFWNRSTGATVWTLAETTEFRGDAASPKDARESGAADVRESDSSMAEKATATPKERALEARDAPPLESELEDALEAATTTAWEVSRRETARLVANGFMDASAAGAFLRSRVPAIESAIERVLSVADGPRASAARDGARRDADAEAKIRSTAPEETETAAVERRAPARDAAPPPLPDSPPPSPPPPPGAIARPPVLRDAGAVGGAKRPKRPDGGPGGLARTATARVISRPPSPAAVERWRAARMERDEDEDGEDEDDPSKRASRREAEVARWRDRAARGEEPGVAGNANFTPVAGDWRRRAAAARLRREREAATTKREPESETKRGVAGDDDERGGDGTSAAADVAAAAAGVDVAAASLGLPRGWHAFYDDDAGSLYYGNAETGETRWDPPTK